jgi:dienelactone hydrolase
MHFRRLVVLLSFAFAAHSNGQDAPAPASPLPMQWVEREFRMPAQGAAFGLDVLKVEVDRPGKHPLALLTHGTSNDPAQRAQITPWSFLPQAIWFARRGYVVLVVVRRGYGSSSGDQGDGTSQSCTGEGLGGFPDLGEASAADLRAAVKYAATLPEADTTTVISAGVSTGGFAQVALTANPPPGLKAAINFAGGRGGDGHMHNCDEQGIVGAFRDFGKRSRLPMLWIYSENDKWFPPDLARKFDAAFRQGGGNDQFVIVPPFTDDGHRFFSNVDGWSAIVETFLKQQDLLPLPDLLPEPPVPNIPPPPGLDDHGRDVFRHFLMYGPRKAFATNGQGGWGIATGMFNQPLADEHALKDCVRNAKGVGTCTIVSRGPQ